MNHHLGISGANGMKIHRLDNWEYWYDRTLRVWYTIPVDEQGNQTGEGFHAATKEEVINFIREQETG